MVKGYIAGLMVESILEDITRTKRMDLVYMSGSMAEDLKGNGEKANEMDLVKLYIHLDNRNMVFGWMIEDNKQGLP